MDLNDNIPKPNYSWKGKTINLFEVVYKIYRKIITKSTPYKQLKINKSCLFQLLDILIVNESNWSENYGSGYCFKSYCGTRSKGQTPAQGWKV